MGREILVREPVSLELGAVLQFVSDFKVRAKNHFCINCVVRALSEGKTFVMSLKKREGQIRLRKKTMKEGKTVILSV